MTQEELHKQECDKMNVAIKEFGDSMREFFRTQRQIREKVGQGIGEFMQDFTDSTRSRKGNIGDLNHEKFGHKLNRRRVLKEVEFNQKHEHTS